MHRELKVRERSRENKRTTEREERKSEDKVKMCGKWEICGE